MICDICQSRNATVRVKKMSAGMLADHFLCAECAMRFGYAHKINRFYSVVPDFPSSDRLTVTCKCCGCSLNDITEMGIVGCAECYQTFRDQLADTLHKIHGEVKYAGRVPASASPRLQREKRITQARAELAEAIEQENFEKAAVLRDYIRELENVQ